METLSFDSSSLDATEEFLSRAYTPMRIGGRPRETGARIARRAVGGLVVDKLHFDYTMAYDAACLGKVCLITLHRGTMVDTTDGRDEVYGPGETFLIAAPDRPYTGELRAARYTITMFDPALLDEVAAGGGHQRGPVSLTGFRAVDPTANRRLGSTVTFLRDQVIESPGAGGLVVATAARHLAAVTLSAFPNSATDGRPGPADSRDAGTATLRRATDFIEENAHRDIGLAEIAAAACVTPRAVQYAFNRHAGTTPLAHLRRVRLAGAHRELRSADPRAVTVTDVAAAWGFAHPGRFAAAYRKAYGTTPSATLRDAS
ncbi:helix-turn-helix transcriptional regulator [Streptomyces genisteinicus]|uniref:Helix-turn-helix transcriptional regulator n=1 Tax=Streptomyces genisteinicus TaxID=2768068 RepID=A0A7H0I244_9ACTN|nr:AraC family transcriptional regulator [Streptomyces genisteinicus]QNP66860.1 helix-turn-helix transcriptional regulator [Streptomyces genisteinicus]